ncbi:MAG: exodeoxyribonuclease V subunit gamma, partial [Candidatus Marinimicrobia bacterium]|nr:exodeoxyribonuclease V subunit gamma [Candidatus Neomarinimicrobiota bacterium]
KGKRKLVAEEFQNIYHRLVSKTKASKLLQGEILYQKIPEMLRHISDQILMSGITFDPSILMRLFREELQSNSSKSDHHSKGIEIVSLMDAASIPSKILFLPGCNEGMLPQNQTNNPILKDAPNRHLDQNLLLFFSLLNRCPDLHISACEEDSSGKALDISSFLQNVTLVNYPAESQKLQNHLERIKTGYRKLSPKQHHYGKYWGKYPSIENTPKSDLFKGNTGLSIGTDRIFSANSMDILLKCPMKYAFRYLLGINSLNESYGDKTFAEIGNSVHHIIAEFSKSGGYDCSTAKEADAIMEKCIQTYEEEKGLDTHTDALFKRNWQPYVKGLANNGKSGLLYEFVYRHYENFQGFQRKAEEFAFGKEPKIPLSDLMPDIYIRGFIDKILVNEE